MEQNKFWGWFWVVSLVILLVAHTAVRVMAQELLYPYEKAKVWLDRTVVARIVAIGTRANHATRNLLLERDLTRLQVIAQENGRLEAEIAHLRQLLQFDPPAPGTWLPCPVQARGGTVGLSQTLRIAKGARHNIVTNAPVIVPEGVVGHVINVSPSTCEVQLITDTNSRLSCELELADNEIGTVRGVLYGGGTRAAQTKPLNLLYVVDPLKLRYLERNLTQIPPRTRVVTSSIGRLFPKGLTVGYVLESSPEENQLTRQALVMPAVDFVSLNEVFIWTKSTPATPASLTGTER